MSHRNCEHLFALIKLNNHLFSIYMDGWCIDKADVFGSCTFDMLKIL